MEEFIKECGFKIPPFAAITPEEWQGLGHEYDEIRDNGLGWDITDYGLGQFDKVGFSLLTLRNGNQKLPKTYPKTYAEKLLMLYEGQTSPMHYHWKKMEDIINRGGNHIYITVYNGAENRSMLDTDVTVHRDGKMEVVPPGTRLCLKPGQSITITPYMYHDFAVPETGGQVLLGEVSMCNDDEHDNCFYRPMGRFPEIEEDEKPYRLLCTEYPPTL